jgi:hypothetical protein
MIANQKLKPYMIRAIAGYNKVRSTLIEHRMPQKFEKDTYCFTIENPQKTIETHDKLLVVQVIKSTTAYKKVLTASTIYREQTRLHGQSIFQKVHQKTKNFPKVIHLQLLCGIFISDFH